MRPRGRGVPDTLTDLLPHRLPALLVTDVIDYAGKSATFAGQIPRDHPCVAAGSAPAILLVDFAAQAAGALLGLIDTREGVNPTHPDRGFLVGLRETRLFVHEVRVDQALEAEVSLEARMDDLSSALFAVTLEGKPAAEGRLSLSTPT